MHPTAEGLEHDAEEFAGLFGELSAFRAGSSDDTRDDLLGLVPEITWNVAIVLSKETFELFDEVLAALPIVLVLGR